MSESDQHSSVLEGIKLSCAKPFRASLLRTTQRRGETCFTLVAKITYQLRQGECAVVADGDSVRAEEEHWDGDLQRSVRYPADLVPLKPASEVLVVGHAHAAGGVPAKSLIVRVVVGSVDKCIEAFSPRRVTRDGQYEELYSLASIPLRYEYAAGGHETDNPVGIDPATHDVGGHVTLPALAPPAFALSRSPAIPSVGLGPIGRAWPTRVRRLRAEDARWLEDMLGRPKPNGFDDRYFNAAPLDQQLDQAIRPDERIILEGLDPALKRLVTNLPGIEPMVVCEPHTFAAPKMIGDTLLIDTDSGLVTLTFRGRIDLPIGVNPTRFSIVPMKAGEEVSGTQFAQALQESPTLTIPITTDPHDVLSKTNFAIDATELGESVLPFSSAGEARARPAAARDTALPFRNHRSGAGEMTQELKVQPKPASQAPPAQAPPPAQPIPAQPQPVRTQAAPAPVQPQPALAQLSSAPKAAPLPLQAPLPAVAIGTILGGSSGKPSYLGKEEALRAPVAVTPPAMVAQTGSTNDLTSAKAASDAAAGREERKAKKAENKPESVELKRRALVDLLTFDRALPPRLRRSATHGALLTALAKARGFRRLDESATQDKEDKEAQDVLRVLSLGAPIEASALRMVVETALDDTQDLDIPILLVAGELRPTFDEVDTLRLTASVAAAFGSNDKRLQATLALVNDAVAASIPPTGKAAQSLLMQIEQATSSLSLPPRYIQETVERALLEQRKYRRRVLFGETRLRAELSIGGMSTYPIYLAEDVAPKLPLLSAFPVIALVEIRPREDVTETHSEALLGLALGRMVRSIR